jgi:UBX domain
MPGLLTPRGIPTPISVVERDLLAASTDTSGEGVQVQSRTVQELFQERRVQMEAKKKKEDEENRAERAARVLKMKELPDTAGPSDPRRAADLKHALLQKKMQRDARDEHTRVLKRIEDDRAERRIRDALRKEQMNAVTDPSRLERPNTTSLVWLDQYVAKEEDQCALQVRLFDGTTIKSRFSSQSTLRESVRRWIADQQLVEDVPYTFKQILTPQQNRAITTSEEEKSLQSIGLVPSSTLILVPVNDYTTAYAKGMRSYFQTVTRPGLWLLSSGFALMTETLRRLFGYGQASEWPTLQNTSQSSIETPTSTIRTFRSKRESSENEQFYNGNAVSTSNS